MSDVGAEEGLADGEVGPTWRGSSMEEIHRFLNEFELEHVPPVRPSDTHTVLHHFPIRAAATQPPRPLRGHHKWDAQHVRLPCSGKSQYPVTGDDGNVSIECRWEMIEKALLRPITNSRQLEAAILSYNSKYQDQWKFRGLHKLFEEELDETEAQVFFEDLLPRIVRLALRLPELVQCPIPLLKQGMTQSVTLTQEQISCLLANGFLCTFPRRNTMKRKSEYSTFPDINFNRLFQSSGHSVLEKIKCICHYFRRVCPTERDSSNVPTGVVTFTRRSIHYTDMPNWSECEAPLGETLLHITSDGTIEDQGLGLLQVDFANKFLGGGVLGSGCVQEEIRFVICPELLVSKLFTECLRPTEALLMVGCERYSNYDGYANSFQWAGNHEDATPRDSSRRRMTHIVAIDALSFVQSSHQYREELMLRELNKAYVGFLHTLETPAPGVASGNWGCGAFGGEATLKALLQLMACAATKRPLVYYTFGNAELRDVVYKMHTFLQEKNVRVCDLWATLKKFHTQNLDGKELYNFIYSCHSKSFNTYRAQHAVGEKETEPANSRSPRKTMKRNIDHTTNSPSEKAPIEASSSSKSPPEQTLADEKRNVSQDLFASSSSDGDDKNEDMLPESVPSTNSQASSRIVISDDSESDAVLMAVVVDKPSTDNVRRSPTTSPASLSASTLKKRAEPKQRTLLEMLDQCYTNGQPAKRPKS